jgi:hypothetical protein
MDVTAMAERELSSFLSAVTELYGPEQTEASADDWLRELTTREYVPASAREWRTLTIAAAAQLASRMTTF